MSALLVTVGGLTMVFCRHSAVGVVIGAAAMFAGWLRLELMEHR